MATYRFHWKDGSISRGKGSTPEEILSKLGYGQGALGALDYWEKDLTDTEFPKRIVLCGSSRFVEWMAVTAWILERDEGALTMGLHLLPWWYSSPDKKISDHLAEHEGVASGMDDLHLRKTEISDEVFVVNRENYVGESTAREVGYARERGIPVRWYTGDPVGKIVEELFEKRMVEWTRYGS